MKIKSTEQLTKDLESIIRRLYRNEDMETVRKIVESTLEQSEKDRIKQGPSKKNKIIKMAKELKTIAEITEEVKCNKSYVRSIRNSEGIYSLKKVRELIEKGISVENIATQGNVNLGAVAKLKESNIKSDKVVELLKEIKRPEEIGNECQCSQAHVYNVRERNKIYLRRQVIKLIKAGESLENIAAEGNVNLEAVVRLKEEIERSKKREKEKTPKVKKIIELSKDLIGDEKIVEKLGTSIGYVWYVRSREEIYSRQKVEKMLRDGISAEEIAKEGNVNLEAVVKLREHSIKSVRAVELLKRLKSPKEIGEECQCSQAYVYMVKENNKIYLRRQVIELIKAGESPEDIATEGNVNLEAVEKLKEEIEKSNKREKKRTAKAEKIIELSKDLIEDKEIAERLGISKRYVWDVRNREGIYPKRKVQKMLKDGVSAEKIAEEGNVNLDAVVKLRDELERSNKREKERTPKVEKIIEFAKNLTEDEEIAERVQCSKGYACHVRNSEKIYPKRKVQKMLKDGVSAEKIAEEGNVNLDAVVKLRDELERSNKREKERTPKVEKIIEFAKNLTEDEEIAKRLKCTRGYACYVRNNEGIYSIKKVTELIELGKSPEEIATEGKVNAEAVTKLKEKLEMEKIRKKEEAEKKEKEKLERRQKSKDSGKNRRKRVRLDEQKKKQLIEDAKNLKSGVEIESILQISRTYVKNIMDGEGIYTRAKVKQLIGLGKSPEEIATEGNVNLDAVIELKNEIEGLRRRKENRTSGNIPGAVYGKRKIIALIREKKTNEEIADLGNVSIEEVEAIRRQLEQGTLDTSKNLYNSRQQATRRTNVTIGDAKAIDAQNGHKQEERITKKYSNTPTRPTYSNNSEYERNADDKRPGGHDRKNAEILQMARQVKSVERIVSALGIPEYTIRNILRKNNILSREDIISLINEGSKTPQEIAQESGCNLHEIEKLHDRIVEMRQRIERNPKRKQALELLQKGKSENEVMATTRLRREIILEMKELIIGRVEKPISKERKQADFKIDMFNLRSSINAMQQHSSRIQAETTDFKIQKILYKYPEFLGRKEYAFFAYAYSKVSEYMKAIDIGEEYLELDTPSISALKSKIEEVLQEEKEKAGATIVDSNGDER